MKYISKITLGLGLFASLLASCKDDEVADSNMGISLDKETIAIGPDGGTESIVVTAGRNWVSSASRPWVAVSPANGFGSVEGSLAIDSTLEVTARTAQVRYRQEDNQEVILTINQFGYGKQIIPSESEIRIESSGTYDERHFDLTVSTNVEFKVDENITYEWDGEPTPEELKSLHKLIKKVTYDIEHFSYNTSISAFMICVNELGGLKCTKRAILEPLVIVLAPFAPHIAEELWHELGHNTTVCDAQWPAYDEQYLIENTANYAISFNGKVRFNLTLPADMPKEEVEKTALAHEYSAKWLEGKQIRKVIVVPKKIVNIVLG